MSTAVVAQAIDFTEQQIEDIRACAEERQCTPSEIIQLALENELAR